MPKATASTGIRKSEPHAASRRSTRMTTILMAAPNPTNSHGSVPPNTPRARLAMSMACGALKGWG